jgi:flagellin-like protein
VYYVLEVSGRFPVCVPLARREKNMNFKKLFDNNYAVSPVIGVILMVAITVILAAAIGSSVFGQGPEKSAPQANIEIAAVNAYNGTADSSSVKLEHLGGDSIDFSDVAVTKIMVSVNGDDSTGIDATSLGKMEAGSVKTLVLEDFENTTSGATVNFKIIDVETGQLVSDKDVKF